MRTYEGKQVAEKIRVGIVAARFNEFITAKLLGGAIDGLVRHNVNEDDIDVAWVPGAFEIPLIAQKMARVPSIQRTPAPKANKDGTKGMS